MSYLGDGDFNKRDGNLFLALDATPPVVLTTTFKTSQAGIVPQVFNANYQAIFPTVIEEGGPWEPPPFYTGPFGTISGANGELITFTDESASTTALTFSPNFGIPPRSVEITIIGLPQFPSVAGIGFCNLGFTSAYNCNVLGGGGPVGDNMYYRSDGFLIGAATIPAPALVIGDVVGIVISSANPGVTPLRTTFFRNGVNVGTVTGIRLSTLLGQMASINLAAL